MTDSIRSEMKKSGESWACSRLYLTKEEIQTLVSARFDCVASNQHETAAELSRMVEKYDENK